MNPGSSESLKEESHHTLVLSSGANETGVAIEAAENGAEVVLVSFTRRRLDSSVTLLLLDCRATSRSNCCAVWAIW